MKGFNRPARECEEGRVQGPPGAWLQGAHAAAQTQDWKGLVAGPRASRPPPRATQTAVSSFPKDRPSALDKGSTDPCASTERKTQKTQNGLETNGKQWEQTAGGARRLPALEQHVRHRETPTRCDRAGHAQYGLQLCNVRRKRPLNAQEQEAGTNKQAACLGNRGLDVSCEDNSPSINL